MNHSYRSRIENCFYNNKSGYELSQNKKWFYFSRNSFINNAGYKLHVSCAVDILERNIEDYILFLFRQGFNFKIPCNLDIARKITNGDFGESQVGKTITIYLDDRLTSVDKIANFFSDTNGPLIPFEVPINPNKTVFIRFGAYKLFCEFDIFGRPLPVYFLNNEKVFDKREVKVKGENLPTKIKNFDSVFDLNNELENNFLAVQLIASNAKSKIYQGIRISDFLSVIIKVVPSRFAVDTYGVSSDIKTLNEFNTLEFLKLNLKLNSPHSFFYKKTTDFSILVVENIENSISFDKLPKTIQLKLFKEIIQQVAILHSSEVIHGDIKMKNILYDNKETYLIDFETSQSPNKRYNNNYGTIGYYLDNENYSNDFYEIDYYCLISLLIGIYLGHDPSLLPFNYSQRIKLLKILGYSRQASLIADVIDQPVLIMSERIQNQIIEYGLDKNGSNEKNECLNYITFFGTINSINNEFNVQNNTWDSNHLYSDYSLAALNIGGAGTLLGLLTICSNQKIILPDYLESATKYLSKFDYGENSNGLFTGKSGLAVSLLLYSIISKNNKLRDISQELFQQTCASKSEPDFFGGTAGVLYAHVLAFSLFPNSQFLESMRELYSDLLSKRKFFNEMVYWEPSGLLEDNKYPFWGLAHGSVGILFSIYKYAILISDDEGINVSIKGLKSVFKNVSSENKSVKRYITGDSKKDSNLFFWCHGIIGYLWVLGQLENKHQDVFHTEISECLQLLDLTDIPLNPTICHGLAGILETYMCFLSNPDFHTQFVNKAYNIAQLLECTVNNTTEQIWHSESPNLFSPDLMVGYAGSAAVLSQFYSNNFNPIISIKNFEHISNERDNLFKR